MKPLRLFIAIELPEKTKIKAEKFLAKIQASEFNGLARWLRPEHLHISLNFIGEVEPREVLTICQLMKEVAQGHVPPLLSLDGWGAFPNEKRPHVYWLGVVQQNDQLNTLQRDLDRCLVEEGYPLEKRKFIPHLTIGRAKKRDLTEEERDGLKSLGSGFSVDPFPVHRIILYSSELGKKGPIYSQLGSCRLG
ncbi:MAG: RNA 2',3'-cyclic phosphodiesterase [Pirellulaceae bacterium]|nr:RNA 2',3'-cyclic phosphodiesterase [Pirellulaceae bacterium]